MAGRIAYYGNIVVDNLLLALDAANKNSYSGTTDWFNLVNRSNVLQLINGPVYKTNNYGVIELDGTNDYIPLTGFTYNRSSFSVESFFKFIGSSNNYKGGIVGKWITGAGTSNEFLLYSGLGSGGITTPGYPQFSIQLSDNTFSSAVDTGTTMTVNTWYHQVGTFDGRYVRVYLNGVLKATTDIGSTKTVKEVVTTKLNIGAFADGAYSTAIQIPIARIYDKTLSATEVLLNFNSAKSRYGL